MPRSRRRHSDSSSTTRPPAPRAGDVTALLSETQSDLPSLLPPRLRLWAGIGTLALLAVALYYVADVLVPFVIAFAIAGILEGQLQALERRGYSRRAATVLVFLLFLMVVTALLLYIVPVIISQLQGLVQELPRYIRGANNWFQEEFQPFLQRHHDTIQRLNLPEDPQVLIDRYSEQFNRYVTSWMSNLLQYVSGLLGKLLWLVIIPIITFFVMVDLPRMRRRVMDMVPEHSRQSVGMLLGALGVVWRGYLKGLTTVALLYGATMAVLFTVLGVRYSVVLGVLAGLLYLVPYLGALLIALTSGMVAFFGGSEGVLWSYTVAPLSWQYTLLVVGVAMVVNTLFDQLLVPRIVGGSVGLHPIASLFALFVGAKLFGVWGMLLAMPVAASLWIVLLALFPSLRPKMKEEGRSDTKEGTTSGHDSLP
ncbi:MAG: AI-2E family transporter [Armatimonadota bacterium]|nr:AI-2E family transporter [bacterium]MDW8104500.1 AI-2E family transporter [Armatimonadota bacterium]MDW8289780.1 AI-2E family transporter [Armatimonadota bacterium]